MAAAPKWASLPDCRGLSPVNGATQDGTWELSGAKAAVGRVTVMADGGYRGTGLLIPYHREPGRTEVGRRGGRRTTAPAARSGPVSSTSSRG